MWLKYVITRIGPVIFVIMVFYVLAVQWHMENYVTERTKFYHNINVQLSMITVDQSDLSGSVGDDANWTLGDAPFGYNGVLSGDSMLRNVTSEQCGIYMRNITRLLYRGSCMVAQTVMEYQCDMLELCVKETHIRNTTSNIHICPCFPQNLVGELSLNKSTHQTPRWRELNTHMPHVAAGGHWRPKYCVPRRRVAVIVPFRDRQRHLRAFLAHIHPIFQQQLIEYRIFVIEQNLPYRFNKASLMNIGYLEAGKMYQMDCVLFHDVDTLIERGDNMVICGDKPIHFAAYSNRHHYNVNPALFGAATLMTKEAFEDANGYSNLYYGWGAEDDDFKNRLVDKKYIIYKAPVNISRCTLLQHERDILFTTKQYSRSMSVFHYASRRNYWYNVDGLSSVRYSVENHVDYPLYTWIHVNLKMPKIPSRALMGKRYITLSKGTVKQMLRTTVSALSVTSKYSVNYGICDIDRRTRKSLPYSRITCRYACDMEDKCKALEYHPATGTSDELCYLVHHVNLCNMSDSTQTEVHIKL